MLRERGDGGPRDAELAADLGKRAAGHEEVEYLPFARGERREGDGRAVALRVRRVLAAVDLDERRRREFRWNRHDREGDMVVAGLDRALRRLRLRGALLALGLLGARVPCVDARHEEVEHADDRLDLLEVIGLEVPPEEPPVDVSARRLALVIGKRVGDVRRATALERMAELPVDRAMPLVRGVPSTSNDGDDDLLRGDLVANAPRPRGGREAADDPKPLERIEARLHRGGRAPERGGKLGRRRRRAEVAERLPRGGVQEIAKRLDQPGAVDGDRLDVGGGRVRVRVRVRG